MKSCLVVDDSRVQRSFTRAIVENLAFACREAPTCEAAISSCRFSMPDVILLDWNMPGISGLDCLQTIRGMPGGDRPKIVLCSANSDIEHILLALDQGADEYIMKPFDQDIVRSKFEQIGAM
ncbi:MAG TPA: response regulator [Stellaceae bacterium]|nr:response regulator [Stellaceae bacterium]